MARKKPAVLDRFAGRIYVLTSKSNYEAEALEVGISLFGGKIEPRITDKTTHVVVAEALGTKATEKAIAAKNRKGLGILTVPADDMKLALLVDQADADALTTAGKLGTVALLRLWNTVYIWADAHDLLPKAAFKNADLAKSGEAELNLTDQDASGLQAPGFAIWNASRCRFDQAQLRGATFWFPRHSSFRNADLQGATFHDAEGCDFEGSDLSNGHLSLEAYSRSNSAQPTFRNATLRGTEISGNSVVSLDFSSCDARDSKWNDVHCENICLRDADLSGSKISGQMQSGDFAGANLQGAELRWLDLSSANLDGADFSGASLLNVKLPEGLNTDAIHGLAAALPVPAVIGPALTALTTATTGTERLQLEWLVDTVPRPNGPSDPTELTGDGVDLEHSRRAWGGYDWCRILRSKTGDWDHYRGSGVADLLQQTKHVLGDVQHRFETVKVSLSKSSLSNVKMTALVLLALAEVLEQELPPADELKAQTKAYRAAVKAAKASSPAVRRKAKADVKAEKQRVERQPPATPVTDLESFMTALPDRADGGRIKNATKMLKGAGFELFHDVTDQSVLGVIKSQSDASLVYACKLTSAGHFSCCTQNLNVCGGLRGALCKHQLVLVIGLVQTGTLDPATAFGWIDMSVDETPALDKDEMADVLLKYKGAEAGEVDWRPTETVPEDFYAF